MRELSLINCRLDNRYDVYARLGRGSYAEIYVAYDTLASPQSQHKKVVIKALNVFLQNDLDLDLERTLVENFQNEAIALDRVRHPNVISRLGHGTAKDLNGTVFHYLVLEYMSGGDLAKLCRKKDLSFSKALFYLEQVCAGLAHAHKKEIIHRDIKPQNLLLSEDLETVKIADFGVARIAQTDAPITRVGTNIYAPPEHSPMLAGQTGLLNFSELTPAADIYSLAKSTYVLTTCESPRYFANQPITELPFAARHEPWAEKLVEVLNKATQTDSRRRFQTVNEFWQELAKLKMLIPASDAETIPVLHEKIVHQTPQPHVSKGYSPLAPLKPKFNTSRDFKLKNILTAANQPASVTDLHIEQQNAVNQTPVSNVKIEPQINSFENHEELQEAKSETTKKFLRRTAVFSVLFFLLIGALFATQFYMRNGGILPGFSTFGNYQIGVANTDVYLRPEPTTNNDPLGIVTKNSRVRVVTSQDDWYKIEIIEHGRSLSDQQNADLGWAYGKYIDIQEQ